MFFFIKENYYFYYSVLFLCGIFLLLILAGVITGSIFLDSYYSALKDVTDDFLDNIIMRKETELTKVEYASSVEITGIRNYIDVTGDITITLPNYSNWYSHPNPFTCEHHIYMKFTNAHTVTFADTIKWQSVPTIKAGTVIDFIFNFIHADADTNFWLGGAVVYE